MGFLGATLVPLFFVCSLGSPAIATEKNQLPTLSFDEGYSQLFGGNNLMLLRDGKTVHISLDERTGAGFASQDLYLRGFFSASIKLPSDYSAGVIVAFYMSNGDLFEKTHDELDFEFLGNVRGKEWRIQTNMYGNGSTATGREERYGLWFDPTEDFHRYSIFWDRNQIIFYIDDVPIREITRSPAIGGDFPSKPMSLYATIWDGSGWATLGGRYKVNYKYAPYVAEFNSLALHGCAVDPSDHSPACDEEAVDRHLGAFRMTPDRRVKMVAFREKYMAYRYCDDRSRYFAVAPPRECSFDLREAKEVHSSSGVRLNTRRRRRSKLPRRASVPAHGEI